MISNNRQILLASGSPRRAQLLRKLIDNFSVIVPCANENTNIVQPDQRVCHIATQKARAVNFDGVIIASDTLVYMDGVYYGKPKTSQKACEMLAELSGKQHSVYSGVCLKYGTSEDVFAVRTDVLFKQLTTAEIHNYVSQFNPTDKAGSYGIQDGVVVAAISGSYSNVVGLPLEALSKKLVDMGIPVKEYLCSEWN